MAQKKVLVCYPCLNGQPHLKSFHSLYAHCTTSKNITRINYYSQESLISRLRNQTFCDFLASDCDYLFCLDSDIEMLNDPKTDNIIDKLVNDDKDFNGGLYSLKKPFCFTCSSIPLVVKDLKYDMGSIECRWLSSGCWFIRRDTIEKLYKAYPQLLYNGDEGWIGKMLCDLCSPMILNIPKEESGLEQDVRKLLSEDWSVCERWRHIGGKIFANTSIILNHIGSMDNLLLHPQLPVKK